MTRHVHIDKVADHDPSSTEIRHIGNRASETQGPAVVDGIPDIVDRTIHSDGTNGPGSYVGHRPGDAKKSK